MDNYQYTLSRKLSFSQHDSFSQKKTWSSFPV